MGEAAAAGADEESDATFGLATLNAALGTDDAEAGGPGFGLRASHMLHELGLAAPALTNEQTSHAHSQFATGERSATDKAIACASKAASSTSPSPATSWLGLPDASGSAKLTDAGTSGLGESHVAQRSGCSMGFSMVQNVHVHVVGAGAGDAGAADAAAADAARDAVETEAEDVGDSRGATEAARAATSAEAEAEALAATCWGDEVENSITETAGEIARGTGIASPRQATGTDVTATAVVAVDVEVAAKSVAAVALAGAVAIAGVVAVAVAVATAGAVAVAGAFADAFAGAFAAVAAVATAATAAASVAAAVGAAVASALAATTTVTASLAAAAAVEAADAGAFAAAAAAVTVSLAVTFAVRVAVAVADAVAVVARDATRFDEGIEAWADTLANAEKAGATAAGGTYWKELPADAGFAAN